MRRLVLVLLLLAATIAPLRHAHAALLSWTGSWDTRWRDGGAWMSLVQQGSHVSGSYPTYGGRIEGDISGRVLEGRWTEGQRSGGITFVLAPDGQSFMGRFDNGQWWTGGRTSAAGAGIAIDQSGAREALRTFVAAGNAARGGAVDELGAAAAVVDFGPAGASMAPGEKLAAARALFDLVDLTTFQLWSLPGRRAPGSSLTVTLHQEGTDAALPLTLVRAADRRWFVAMPDAPAMAAARHALLARSGGRPLPPGDYRRRASPRDAMRSFIAAIDDWAGEGRAQALAALDLTSFSDATRAYEGELSAKYLDAILDRVGTMVPQEIPDDPARREPFLVFSHPAGQIVLAPITAANGAVSWRFSADTVASLRSLYTAVEDMPSAATDTVPPPPSAFMWLRRWVRGLSPGLLDEAAGVEVWQGLGIIVLLAVAAAVAWAISFVLAPVLRLAVGGRQPAAERKFRWPLRLVLTFALFRATAPVLGLGEDINRIVVGATGIILALGVMWCGWSLVDAFGDRSLKRAERRAGTIDEITVSLVLAGLKIALLVGGLLFIADELSLPYGGVVAGLGIGGLAVAFASKETLSNVFGAALLAADRPFRRGDWISSGEVAGTVEHVGIRSTRIRTAADSLMFVPNGKLADATVNNMGTRRLRLVEVKPVLAHGTPPAQVEAFVAGLSEVVADVPRALPNRVQAGVSGVTLSGIEIGLTCYLDAPVFADELAARNALMLGVLRLAERLGIRLGRQDDASFALAHAAG